MSLEEDATEEGGVLSKTEEAASETVEPDTEAESDIGDDIDSPLDDDESAVGEGVGSTSGVGSICAAAAALDDSSVSGSWDEDDSSVIPRNLGSWLTPAKGARRFVPGGR